MEKPISCHFFRSGGITFRGPFFESQKKSKKTELKTGLRVKQDQPLSSVQDVWDGLSSSTPLTWALVDADSVHGELTSISRVYTYKIRGASCCYLQVRL